MKKIIVTICFLSCISSLKAQDSTINVFRKDFEFLWAIIKKDYAYWDKRQTDWESVRTHYLPLFDTVTSKASFILMLEKVFNEFYDHHASVSSNTRASQRLVPSGTDIWAEFRGNKPIIIEVRQGYGAERVGLRAGMEILAVNDIPVSEGIKAYLPKFLKAEDPEARNFALRLLLAGRFIDDRKIAVRDGKNSKTFFPDRPRALLREYQYPSDIESKVFEGNVGYIKINNRLGDNALIQKFDSVLSTLRNTKSLILDLRATPSGGNTTVARSILGSFISKESFYQKHELTVEERTYGIRRAWIELVSPRRQVYTKPIVVLVNHWTGSVGEAIAIGFDGLKRAKVMGTPMARLQGAIYSYTMPNTGIGFSFPVEKLYHVNGSPREDYIPYINIDLSKQKANEDLLLLMGLKYLKK